MGLDNQTFLCLGQSNPRADMPKTSYGQSREVVAFGHSFRVQLREFSTFH